MSRVKCKLVFHCQPSIPPPAAVVDAAIVARLVREVEELLHHVTNENFEAAADTAKVLQQSNLGKTPPSPQHTHTHVHSQSTAEVESG